MRKLLLTAAVSVLVGTANAQSAFEGFYGQVGVGYESVDANIGNGTVVSSGSAYTITSGNSNSVTGNIAIGSYFGISQTLLLGVGAEYSPFAGSNENYTLNILNLFSGGSWKKKNSYNIFLSPAYVIDKDKLAYAKVGFTGSSSQFTAIDGTKDTKNFTGYSLGLGYKQIINGDLYGFAEANYASYGSKQIGGDLSGSIKPTTMNFLVGVGYKF
jgi:outer membrane immunogenic protein